MSAVKSILFVNPSDQNVYKKFRYADYQFPLGLAYVISPIKSLCEVEVYDCSWDNYDTSRLVEKLLEYNSECIAFTCTTPQYNQVRDLATELKEVRPELKIIVGGHHISALYESIHDSCFDYLFVGEGENSLLDFVLNGSSGRIVEEIGRTNIDEYELPHRGLFYREDFIDTRLGSKFTYIVTSRGCVGKCKYCVAGARSRVRLRSVDSVVEEVDHIVNNLDIHRISVQDDNFLVNPDRTVSICSRLVGFDLEYYVMGIPKFVNERVLRALDVSGCTWICYGVESGDDDILKSMGRLSNTDDVRRAVDLTRKCGIKIRASFMLGWVGETEEQMMTTLDFIRELQADENAVAIVTPYPGTQLWEDHVDNKEAVNFDRFCYYNQIGWNLSQVSDQRLLEIQQEAFAI